MSTTTKPVYDAEVTETALNAASVTTGTDGDEIDATSHVGLSGVITADFPASPTDNLVVEIRGGNVTGEISEMPLRTLVVTNDTDPNTLAYVIEPTPAFVELHCYRSGSTDTITVTHKYRLYNYQTTED